MKLLYFLINKKQFRMISLLNCHFLPKQKYILLYVGSDLWNVIKHLFR